MKRRKEAILLVVLVAELCGLKGEAERFMPIEDGREIYEENGQVLN